MERDLLDERLEISLTPREAHELITKLATDDAFRSRLESEPREILAQYHITLPVADAAGRVALPSKESLQHALRRFKESGEIDLEVLTTDAGWPLMCFWWLYMTPAKPRRGKKGDTPHVQSRLSR
jgi:putative modified peptide